MKRHLLRWAVLAGIVLVFAGIIVGLPFLGLPGLRNWFVPAEEKNSPPGRDSQARLASGSSEEIELPPDVVERLGVTSEAIRSAAAPWPLRLAGSLFFDPNRYGSVQSRFPGEVVAIGSAYTAHSNGRIDRRDAGPTSERRDAGPTSERRDAGPTSERRDAGPTSERRDAGPTSERRDAGPTSERPLESGDTVAQGQLMAVVLSKDLGEKKSELVDTLVQLELDEVRLTDREKAYRHGALPEDTLNQTRKDVAADRNSAAKAERTLRTWKVSEEEIKAVKDEARLVSTGKKKRDFKKELEWAKVEVRAPFDGTIVEKNASLGRIVDSTFDLFKIADLRKLGVVVHAYEEDLHTLKALPPGFPWEVRAGADLNHRLLPNNGLQKIGLVVDPAQHTDPVMGLVDNNSGELRVGQFVTATVNLPAPPKVVSVPSSALAEDGAESIVFVQPNPAQPRYVRRRVSVAMRLRDVVYVRSELIASERKKGLQEVKPGEVLVTEGVLELQATLEDLQARAKAQK